MAFIILGYSIYDLLCLSYETQFSYFFASSSLCLFLLLHYHHFIFYFKNHSCLSLCPINTNVKCDKYKVRKHMYRITYNNVIVKNNLVHLLLTAKLGQIDKKHDSVDITITNENVKFCFFHQHLDSNIVSVGVFLIMFWLICAMCKFQNADGPIFLLLIIFQF